MKKYFALFLIGFCVFSIAYLLGCGQQATTTATYISYFPLIAGRVITYEVTSHWETPISSSEVVTGESISVETWQYVGFVSLSSTLEVFKINISSVPHYFREDSSGVYRYGSGTTPTTEATVWIKYPLEVGATWESGYIWWPHGVIAEEDVSTEAGVFNCKKVDLRTFPGSWDYEWFARDVGLIKKYSGYGGVGTSWTDREIISKNF